jgi:putative glutamine amidotransferase
LEVNARSGDGLIEGLEDPHREFVMSVQWHPEALGQKSIISALVQAAT